MSSEWPTLLTMIIFLVKSVLNVEIGTYNPGQLPNPTGHFLLWFHTSGKKA